MSDKKAGDIVAMPPVLGALVEWSGNSGFDTHGCTCGHDRLGPLWHLSTCPWPATAWESKARQLAQVLDAMRHVPEETS